MEIFSCLGAQYGNIDINQVLRSSTTISSHIHELADNERAHYWLLLLKMIHFVYVLIYGQTAIDNVHI